MQNLFALTRTRNLNLEGNIQPGVPAFQICLSCRKLCLLLRQKQRQENFKHIKMLKACQESESFFEFV